MFATAFLFSYFVLVRGFPIIHEPPAESYQSIPNEPDAELLGGAFQGDMILPRGRGVAIFGDQYRWPQKTIPYDISAITEAKDRETITKAMQTLMYAVGTPKSGTTDRSACVFFRPRQSSDTSFLTIQYGNGCSATVGFVTRYKMRLTLQQNACFRSGTIQHELLHVIGFWHEQSRPDRDTYLDIHYENVQPKQVHNFNKYAWGSTAYNQGYPYDYSSVMHYGTRAFSANGKPTTVPKQAGAIIGLREKLSDQDILEVRDLYKCNI